MVFYSKRLIWKHKINLKKQQKKIINQDRKEQYITEVVAENVTFLDYSKQENKLNNANIDNSLIETDYGANVNIKNKNGKTAIDLCQKTNLKLILQNTQKVQEPWEEIDFKSWGFLIICVSLFYKVTSLD